MEQAFSQEIVRTVAYWFLVPLAICFLIIAFRLILMRLTDPGYYRRNQERSPSTGAVLRGQAPTTFDGVQDERVAAGLAVDTAKNAKATGEVAHSH